MTDFYQVSWAGLTVLEDSLGRVKLTLITTQVLGDGHAAAIVSTSYSEVTRDGISKAVFTDVASEVVRDGDPSAIHATNTALEVMHDPPPETLLKITNAYLQVLQGWDEDAEDYFKPPVPPTIESEVTFTAEPNEADVNDEWNDSSINGLNSVHGVYSLVWAVLLPDQYEAINRFLVRKRGLKPFRYQIPSESTYRTFKCKTWTKSYLGGTYSLRAEFREVFDLKRWLDYPFDNPSQAKVDNIHLEVLCSVV